MMPQACFDSFKTVSYDDKLYLYNTIERFSKAEHDTIHDLIHHFVARKRTTSSGLELICRSIKLIVKNVSLRFLLENGVPGRDHCYLVDMISAFVAHGFAGSVNYYIRKGEDVDKGVRKASEFVFNTLRYQVVKYFGLFNMVYKNYIAKIRQCKTDEVSGIEALLLRLEYGADTLLGRRASDIGASSRVIKYYDTIAINKEQNNKNVLLYNALDDYERNNVRRINQLLFKV